MLLEKYKSILSHYEKGKVVLKQLTIVLSGRKPCELIKREDARLVFIDEDLKRVNEDIANRDLYLMASCKYSEMISWKGKGVIRILKASACVGMCLKLISRERKFVYGPRRK